MEHQIRLYAPLYQGEKLGLSFEGRFTIAEEQDWNNDGKIEQISMQDIENMILLEEQDFM